MLRGAGFLARVLGRLDEAIMLYRRAVENDPLFGQKNLGLILFDAGRLDEAKFALEDALELNPEMEFTHGLLAQVFLARGNPTEALAEAGKDTNPAYRLLALALAYHAVGQHKDSDASLTELTIRPMTGAPRTNNQGNLGSGPAMTQEPAGPLQFLPRC